MSVYDRIAVTLNFGFNVSKNIYKVNIMNAQVARWWIALSYTYTHKIYAKSLILYKLFYNK